MQQQESILEHESLTILFLFNPQYIGFQENIYMNNKIIFMTYTVQMVLHHS